MRRPLAMSLTLIAALATGCTGPGSPDASPPGPTPSAGRSPVYPSPTIIRAETDSTVLPGATLTPDGLGPIQLGLGVAEGRERGWVARLDHCDRWGSSPGLLAEGVDLVFDDGGRLAEVWLGNASHRTADWARVGMHIDDVTTLYRERLEFEPRDSVAGGMYASFVREGDRELLFYALGDEGAAPGPRAPVSAIAARAYGGDVERPSC